MINEKNKRGNVTYVFVLIIILVISFFIYLGVFGVLFNNVESQTNDLACKTLVKLKDSTLGSFTQYIYDLNNKCHVDKKIIKGSLNEDKVFSEFAKEANSCWNRYGNGEYDFLEKYQVSGSWCFLCGSVKFNSNDDFSKEYSDFIDWSKIKDNGIEVDGEKKSYYDEIGFKYADPNSRELRDLDVQIKELSGELGKGGLGGIGSLLLVLEEKHESLLDLQLKTISSDNKYYVVYRYDRFDKNLDERLSSAVNTATNSIIGGIVASMVAESVIIGGVSGGACLGSGIGTLLTPVCALVGGGVGAVKGIFTGIKSTEKILRIGKLFSKISKMIKFSKVKKIQNTLKKVVISGKAIMLNKKIETMKVSVKDLKNMIGFAKKAKEINTVKRLEGLLELFTEFNVESLVELKTKIMKSEKARKKLAKIMNKNDKLFDITNPKLWKNVKLDKNLEKEIEDLKTLEQLAKEEVKNFQKGIKVEEPIAIMTYLRATFFVSGATIGALIPDTEPQRQYVDIMTQEQYYRSCGTEPKSK